MDLDTRQETIFALSTSPGRAGVAVIRVSGPAVAAILQSMIRNVPPPRHAAFRTIRHPETRDALDGALVIWFAGPDSETGEDVAEFQTHGSPAVVRAVLDALSGIARCRPAEPGEFARRAFLNGKLDLAQVEGLADLIDAETEAQRRQALAQSSGALSALYERWRAEIIGMSALAEAAIDFSDESDVAASALADAGARARLLLGDIERHLDDGHRGEILRDGFRVALTGAPNAGKSSLLNALARRDAAIVSAEAGTTRDVIEVRLDLGGHPVIVSDTAGIRETQSAVEREGIRRSLSAAKDANLVLWLTESGDSTLPHDISRETSLVIRSKADLAGESPSGSQGSALAVSARTGLGIDVLLAEISRRAGEAIGSTAEPPLTRTRHRANLEMAAGALRDVVNGDPAAAELRAEDFRRAAHAIGRITGRVDVEDVLGQIFGRFCIGK